MNEKHNLTLTLPTGSTPLNLYERLRFDHAHGRFSLDEASVFMLDEYLDVATYPKGSFLSTLQQQLGPVIFNDRTTVHSLRPPTSPTLCADYDAQLDGAGGLDLAIVGVGRNGHVGFNEPGTPLSARTHLVNLTKDTLDANFPGIDEGARPRHAVTIGLADLLSARSVVMLVMGDKKRVAHLLANEVEVDDVPATRFLAHPDLSIVIDDSLL